MKIVAMSELFAIRLAKDYDKSFAIISITDPPKKGSDEKEEDRYVDFGNNPNIHEVLRLAFYDIDPNSFTNHEVFKIYEHGLFTEEQAEKILSFAQKMKEEGISRIVVHCGAGVSRSAGVAAALLLIFTGTDKRIFNDKRYIPNKYVYRMILNAYFK